MRERFDRRDALTMLAAIDDDGIERGTIGQCVHALVDTIADTSQIMESICIDASQERRIRHNAILFAVDAAQSESREDAIALLDRIAPSCGEQQLAHLISWLRSQLRQFGCVSLY
jgi:hypothetical protein